MKKVLRHNEVNPENVVSLGKANITVVDPDAIDPKKYWDHGYANITSDAEMDNIPVEIFMETYNNSIYMHNQKEESGTSVFVYAGDKDGNIYEHLIGYVGLWLKTKTID